MKDKLKEAAVQLDVVGERRLEVFLVDLLAHGRILDDLGVQRAVALDPAVMLYDEPFTGLDPISVGIIGRLIKRLHRALGMTSVIVTHDINETLRLADRIVVLANGRICRMQRYSPR